MAGDSDIHLKRGLQEDPDCPTSESSRKRKRRDEERSHRKHARRDQEQDNSVDRATSREGRIDKFTSSRARVWQEKEKTVVRSVDGSELYVIDRKGDRQNLIYESLDRWKIPLFRRWGNGGVLGLPTSYRIERDLSDDKVVVVQHRLASRREGRRPLLAHRSSGRIVRRILPNAASIQDLNADFVRLSSSKQRDDEDSRIPSFSLFDTGRDADSEDEAADDSGDDGTEVDQVLNEAKAKQAELSKRTTSNPTDVRAWLDLITHQELMLRLGTETDTRAMSRIQQRSLADVRISIYQKALKAVQKHSDQVELVLGLLREGAKIWDSKQLTAKWREFIERYPRNLDMRLKYIDFIQSNISVFSYEKCLEAYQQSLKTAENLDGAKKLRLLVRLTRFMRESGYHELAIAIWQMFLEYHMLDRGTRNRDRDTFEDFWAGEVARIGEKGAKGWAHYLTPSSSSANPSFSEDTAGVPEVVRLEDDSKPTPHDCFQQFGILESHRKEALLLPGRAADDVGEDDPFHMIMSNDIFDYLSFLQPPVEVVDVVSAVLEFVGLPPLPSALRRSPSDSTLRHGDSRHHADQYLRVEMLQLSSQDPALGAFQDHLKQLSRLPLKSRVLTTEHLFSDAFEAIKPGALVDWVCRVLEFISTSTGKAMEKGYVIQEYYVALEWHFSPSSAVKTAKRLLKKHPSNLRLYNAIALMESRKGRVEESNRIFMTALDLASNLSQEDQENKILLLRTWVWEALRLGNVTTAASRLMTLGSLSAPRPASGVTSESGFTPGATLRVKRMLADGVEHISLSSDAHIIALHGECLALLEYLQRNCDFEAADASLRQSISKTEWHPSHRIAKELLHQARARLLANHATYVRTFKPSAVRNAILTSINLFPANTEFLTVFAANETKFRIDRRIQALLATDQDCDEETKFSRSVFAIWIEMNRGVELGGTKHAIRSAFENAVQDDAGKHSSALWTSYVHYELELRDFERAKNVFLRGVTQLPWSKDFMMLAFTKLVDHLSFQEVKRVYDVFEEKELRVMVNIEEQVLEREEIEQSQLVPVSPNVDSSGDGY